MSKLRLTFLFCIGSFFLGSVSGYAQVVEDRPGQADIARELESLKKRIAELEAQLRDASPAIAALPANATLPAQTTAEAVSRQEQKREPFSFADFTWLTGNPRTTESPLDSKVFTGEVRVDTDFVYDFNGNSPEERNGPMGI